MKYLILAALTAFSLTACTSSTQYGECVGVMDEKLPNLEYRVSTRNVVLGLLGAQLLLIPPAIVVLDELSCPIGVK